ncbi:MAG: hypothetical protein ABSH25_14835 [Syntrophorhabdales bacterium]|jgi:hypothetical protein
MEHDLSEQFENVRRAFFPRWDKEYRWRIQYVDDLPSEGLCDPTTKTISVNTDKGGDATAILLIHEICHAVAWGHGKAWLARMLKAADVALDRGDLSISDDLRKQVEQYSKTPVTRASEVYGKLEDWVFDRPDVPYERMIEAVARFFAMHPDMFEHRFKRCRRVYEKAKVEAREEKPRE